MKKKYLLILCISLGYLTLSCSPEEIYEQEETQEQQNEQDIIIEDTQWL
ncbi:hypothetical protein [Winogradskyella sp. R77965]